MTLQEIYTKVKNHLLTQGVQSTAFFGDYSSEPKCAYRGRKGTACAVGCLISDEHYDCVLEGRRVDTRSVKRALIKSGIETDDNAINFLGELQLIHDSVPPEQWKDALEELAESQGLKP